MCWAVGGRGGGGGGGGGGGPVTSDIAITELQIKVKQESITVCNEISLFGSR